MDKPTNKRAAFVELTWMDDGAAMAGGNYGRSMPAADVIEVMATDESDAARAGLKKLDENRFAGAKRARFFRWVNP